MPMNAPITSWQGRRVWVVGASTGIGAAIAASLLDRGARVALSARRREPLEELASRNAGNALVLPIDVTLPAEVREAFVELKARWGGADVVLLVAGSYRPMRAWEFDANWARALFELNVMGVMNVLSEVLPFCLEACEGHIAIVSSVAGYRGLPKALVYGPTKAALINLAEGLYLDLAPRGIGVSVINPGFVKTPLTDDNDFDMPALITPAEAAAHTLLGLERGEFEIHYPKRFTRWLKLLRLLPYRWYFPIVHRITGL